MSFGIAQPQALKTDGPSDAGLLEEYDLIAEHGSHSRRAGFEQGSSYLHGQSSDSVLRQHLRRVVDASKDGHAKLSHKGWSMITDTPT